MTPQQILESLKSDGIELISVQGNLKVRATKSKITDDQKSLISANKSELLNYLAFPEERNSGSLAPSVTRTAIPSDGPVAPGIFKEYKLPSGETLQLTREEFDRVVDVFRALHEQSQKLGQNNVSAS